MFKNVEDAKEIILRMYNIQELFQIEKKGEIKTMLNDIAHANTDKNKESWNKWISKDSDNERYINDMIDKIGCNRNMRLSILIVNAQYYKNFDLLTKAIEEIKKNKDFKKTNEEETKSYELIRDVQEAKKTIYRFFKNIEKLKQALKSDEINNTITELADYYSYTYSDELTDWFTHDLNDRFVNEALFRYGHKKGQNIFDLIRKGQYVKNKELFNEAVKELKKEME